MLSKPSEFIEQLNTHQIKQPKKQTPTYTSQFIKNLFDLLLVMYS